MAKNKTTNKILAISAAGAAATAVGSYWFLGAKNSKKHRKAVADWVFKAQKDLVNALRKMKKVEKDAYLHLVDMVMKKYAKADSVTGDIMAVTREMKAAWPHIRKAIKPAKKVLKKATKRIKK